MSKFKIIKGNVLFQSGQVHGPGFEFSDGDDGCSLAGGQLERYLAKGVISAAPGGKDAKKSTKVREPEVKKG